MKLYSFENAEITTTYDNIDGSTNVIYDLFERKMAYNNNILNSYYITNVDDECRIDLVTRKIYEDTQLSEEIMIMNNIINPFSIKTNDIIYYSTDKSNIDLMKIKEPTLNQGNKYKILNINKNKSSGNRESLPPSVNPGMKQIDIDYNKKKITIINKFK